MAFKGDLLCSFPASQFKKIHYSSPTGLTDHLLCETCFSFLLIINIHHKNFTLGSFIFPESSNFKTFNSCLQYYQKHWEAKSRVHKPDFIHSRTEKKNIKLRKYIILEKKSKFKFDDNNMSQRPCFSLCTVTSSLASVCTCLGPEEKPCGPFQKEMLHSGLMLLSSPEYSLSDFMFHVVSNVFY